MSSRDSSTSGGSSGSPSYAPVVTQETFRAERSQNHRGERIERTTGHGGGSVTFNHHARGYERHAPSPNYSHSSAYRKSS
ncbi:hypothetical protein F4678DRAFT_456125 [Xylaria arbuscula]|nr:hypothetical protein F4678DRAFT_456125 [Xylaria arbuscula]